MARQFATRTDWSEIAASDLPDLGSLNGLARADQISPEGLTGQTIQDIGSNRLSWRYPSHCAGPTAYYILPFNQWVETFTPTVETADVVQVCGFVLPVTVTIAKIAVRITDPGAAGKISFGLYAPDGNVVIRSTALTVAALGNFTLTLTGAAPILPGAYYWAWTTNETSIVFGGINTDADFISMVNNDTVHRSTAANASVGGLLPTSLGALTASTDPIAFGILQG